MTEFNEHTRGLDSYDPEDLERELAFRRQVDEKRQLLEARATAEPGFDYWEQVGFDRRPKRTIGEYVFSKGYNNVPLIWSEEEWRHAFDNNEAMIRSELHQDYSGMSGLLLSEIVGVDLLSRLPGNTADFREELERHVKNGLRSLELEPDEYMRVFRWPYSKEKNLQAASRCGVELETGRPTTSLWRYIHGTKVRVFRDPSVDGRYHFGTRPVGSYIAGWTRDMGQYGVEMDYGNGGPSISPDPLIRLYEEIRALPRFDNLQAPLLELLVDKDGEMQFLQYLKTGHRVNPVEPFKLPAGEDLIRTGNVRGATDPDGKELRIYIAPRKHTKRMEGQGFYFSLRNPSGLSEQLMSMMGDVVVHEAYVALKNNHFNSAPLYKPQVGIGLMDCSREDLALKLEGMVHLVHGRTIWDETPNHNVYVDARVTANGREATIESDWQPHFEEF